MVSESFRRQQLGKQPNAQEQLSTTRRESDHRALAAALVLASVVAVGSLAVGAEEVPYPFSVVVDGFNGTEE